jgi:hypothetical protein
MKIGSGLALIGVGAILAFAVTANTSFFNLHTAGWVLMIIGVIGMLLPTRTYGWLGRRVVRRTYPGGSYTTARVEQVAPYPARGPQALPSRPTLLEQEQDFIEDTEVPRSGYGRPVPGATEVVEDIYEQP